MLLCFLSICHVKKGKLRAWSLINLCYKNNIFLWHKLDWFYMYWNMKNKLFIFLNKLCCEFKHHRYDVHIQCTCYQSAYFIQLCHKNYIFKTKSVPLLIHSFYFLQYKLESKLIFPEMSSIIYWYKGCTTSLYYFVDIQ